MLRDNSRNIIRTQNVVFHSRPPYYLFSGKVHEWSRKLCTLLELWNISHFLKSNGLWLQHKKVSNRAMTRTLQRMLNAVICRKCMGIGTLWPRQHCRSITYITTVESNFTRACSEKFKDYPFPSKDNRIIGNLTKRVFISFKKYWQSLKLVI